MKRLLLIALVLCPFLASCQAPPCPSPGCVESSYTGTGPKVVVLGDSLTVHTHDRLYELLAGDHSLKIAAWQGEGYAGGPYSDVLIAGGWSTRPMMLTLEDQWAPDNPKAAVLALGTNDAWTPATTAQQAIDAATEMRADFACVVAVTATEHSAAVDYDNTKAAEINAYVRSTANVVVDWETITLAHPEYVGADTVHSTALGNEARAQAIDAAVDGCP